MSRPAAHMRRLCARIAGVAVAAAAFPPAFAHHGWSWAEDERTELRGTVREVYIGQPHPTLRIEAADGVWIVELANPRQTERSGFSAGSARPGDPVVALGNRSRAPGERRMKAVRITVGSRTYDIYPERLRGT